MLAGMRKQLFEAHWRVGNELWASWLCAGLFYLFALLAGANIWVFGMRCQSGGRRTIHVANGFVLFFGAVFIFLTFHEGGKNYFYPVLNGVLGWKDLGPYLSLNLFFRWPYLAAWILVYAFIYYGLIRTRREHLLLRVTGVFAAMYTALCLGDLKDYPEALAGVDCLGIACLVAGRGKAAFGIRWFLAPAMWIGFLYVIFRQFSTLLSSLSPQFVLIASWSVILFAGTSALAWRRGFYAGWSWLLPFAFFGFFLLANNNYPVASNYNKLLCLGLWLPRYFLGELGLAAILFVAASCYRKFHPRGSLWWLDVVNLILMVLALIDLRLSQIMGARLDCHLLAFGDTPKMMWRMAQPYLPSLVALLAGMVFLYVIVLWLIGRWRPLTGEGNGGFRLGQGGTFFLLTFVLLGLGGSQMATRDNAQGQTVFLLAGTSPLWKKAGGRTMDIQTLAVTLRELGMGKLGAATATPPVRPARDLNVVLIFQESAYNKYSSLFGGKEETQPLLSQYKERMELFPNFFSNFAGSIYARFAAFTGLYPVRDFHRFTVERVEVKSVFEALHDNGYACSMFYSAHFDYTSFRDFLRGRSLDEMYDADTMPGQRKTGPVAWGLREEETLGAIQDRIKKYAAGRQKFFLTYVPAAPHQPFDSIPDRFRKYKLTEFDNYEPSYINEMLYMDWVIASILDELKTDGLLDKTLVIITADHGEMLGVNGGPKGHGWVVTPELANIPLIIMDPDKPGYRVNETIGSEVDLLPTIMDTLGLPVPGNQLYQGVSLFGPNANSDRLIYLNSLRQYAIVRGRQIICGDRDSETGIGKVISRKVYELSNDGSHAIFVETQVETKSVPMISSLDNFQMNFLGNYSQYCQMIWLRRSTNN